MLQEVQRIADVLEHVAEGNHVEGVLLLVRKLMQKAVVDLQVEPLNRQARERRRRLDADRGPSHPAHVAQQQPHVAAHVQKAARRFIPLDEPELFEVIRIPMVRSLPLEH